MSIKSTILTHFQEVAKESNVDLAPLTDDLPLTESGLDSLWFAIVVTRLEEALGVDPFADLDESRFPTTVGDFVKIYEDAAK
jgi:acyl carrier protein